MSNLDLGGRSRPILTLILVSLLLIATPRVGAQVVINEIMYNPSSELGADEDFEYVELINAGPDVINLQGWTMRDDNDENVYVMPDAPLAPGETLVICHNPAAVQNHYGVSNVLGPFDFRLANGGDTVRIFDPSGRLDDFVAYDDRGPWPEDADGDGASLELVHPSLDNGLAQSWLASRPLSAHGTPGRPNSQAISDAPPQISLPVRDPVNPSGFGGPVTITARVTDPGGVGEVMLLYNAGVGWQSVPMFDDGAHGDGAAGDMRFGASIPPRPDQTLVRYRFSASDGLLTSYLPPGAPSESFHYRVLDAPPAPGDVMINEIMYHNPLGRPADVEWVELYNASPRTHNLWSWRLTDENESPAFELPGVRLGPGEFVVLTSKRAVFEQLHGAGRGPVVAGLPFRLSNRGDRLSLYSINGDLIDRVHYEDRLPWPPRADGEGPSLEAVDPLVDNDNFQNWGASLVDGGTPGAPNSCLGLADRDQYNVVINEIMYDPVQTDHVSPERREFVELVNRGIVPVSLAGWRFVEGIDYTFPDITLDPARHLVIYKDGPAFERAYGASASRTGAYGGVLDDGGEDLALANAHGVIIDYVDYDDVDPWPAGADGDGFSLELVNVWRDNNHPRNWRNSRENHPDNQLGAPQDPFRDADERYMNPDIPHGSPGFENTRFSTHQPPYVTDVRHWPPAPTTADVVRVTARVEDPDGIQNVFLNYKVVAPGEYVPKDRMDFGSWTSILMGDEGIGPDVTAGDGIYTVSFAGFPHRGLVRYRICATDPFTECVVVPYKEDPVPNYSFFVHDGVPDYHADNGRNHGKETAAQGPRSHADLAGPAAPPVYHLIADRHDLLQAQYLDFDHEKHLRERDVERALGTFVFDYYDERGEFHREVHDHVMYRCRGGFHRYHWPKRSWRIRLRRGQKFFGVDRFGRRGPVARNSITLLADAHNHDRERGEGGIAQALGHWLCRKAGVIGADTNFAQLRVIHSPFELGERLPDGNEPSDEDRQYYGDFWGLFTDISSRDEDYLEINGRPEQGTLYESLDAGEFIWIRPDEFGWIDPNFLRAIRVGKHTNPWDWDFGPLLEFVEGYAQIDPELTRDFLRDRLNFRTYNRSRAIELFIQHFDMGGHNYLLYQNPVDGRWEEGPWDLDNTFGSKTGAYDWIFPSRSWRGQHLFHYYEQVGEYLTGYRNELRSLTQLMLNLETLTPLLDDWSARIQALADADEDRWDYVQFPIGVPEGQENIGGTNFNWLDEIGDEGQEAQEGEYRPFAVRHQRLRDWIKAREVDVELTTGLFGHVDDTVPGTPVAVSPANGQLVDTATPALMASEFTDPDHDVHLASQWLLAQRNDNLHTPPWDWMDPVWESPEITGNSLESVRAPAGVLEPDREYRWRVRYKDADGLYGHWSEPAAFRAGSAPGEPFIAEARAIGTTAELVYLQVPGADHYRLRYGVESGEYDAQIDGLTETRVQVSGLLMGFEYFFVVEAVNGFGPSSPSNEVRVLIEAPPESGTQDWGEYGSSNTR